MGKIRIRTRDQLEWQARISGEPGEDDVAVSERYGPVADDYPGQCHQIHHPGSESELQLFTVRLPPGDGFDSHAHRTDEIIYVLEGELHFGAQVIPAGSSVYVPADTLYAFKAGPNGLTFLNFRAVRDDTFITKAQFVAERAARRQTSFVGDSSPG